MKGMRVSAEYDAPRAAEPASEFRRVTAGTQGATAEAICRRGQAGLSVRFGRKRATDRIVCLRLASDETGRGRIVCLFVFHSFRSYGSARARGLQPAPITELVIPSGYVIGTGFLEVAIASGEDLSIT